MTVARVVRRLRETVDELRRESLALVHEMRGTVGQANSELERADSLSGQPVVSATTRVDSASGLAYEAFSNPVIKVLAFGSGTARPAGWVQEEQGLIMFKRLFWLVTGASRSAGMSCCGVNRLLKRTVERYAPRRVGTNLTGTLAAFGGLRRRSQRAGQPCGK